jgi:AraC-like DNA-binding protein
MRTSKNATKQLALAKSKPKATAKKLPKVKALTKTKAVPRQTISAKKQIKTKDRRTVGSTPAPKRLPPKQVAKPLIKAAVKPNANRPNPQIDSRVHKAMEYIKSHLTGYLSLEKLASIAELSPWHFARTFKSEAGISPHQLVLQLRLERAKAILETSTPIAEIATLLRFSDRSHFTMYFKRAYGVTPRRFRLELQNAA